MYHTERQGDIMHLSPGPVLSCLHHINLHVSFAMPLGVLQQAIGKESASTWTAPTTGMSNSKGISVVLKRPFREMSDTPTCKTTAAVAHACH